MEDRVRQVRSTRRTGPSLELLRLGAGYRDHGVGLSDDGRQLENLSPRVLYPSGQKQIWYRISTQL